MSSGSYTSPGLGFCNTGKPTLVVLPCESAAAEPRGPELLLAGLCVTCGVSTTERDTAGNPRHAPPPVPDAPIRLRPPPPEAA